MPYRILKRLPFALTGVLVMGLSIAVHSEEHLTAKSFDVPADRAHPSQGFAEISRIIPTEYFSLKRSKLDYDFGTEGGGGAIAVSKDAILYATAEGKFFRIDPTTGRVVADAFAPLELGREGILQSKNITYWESPPRVHDIIEIADTYYVSYDFYDPVSDRVSFRISSYRSGQNGWSEIYRSVDIDTRYYALGNSGMFASDGKSLYFSVGDYSLDRKNNLPTDFASQNPSLPFGKIMQLDLASRAVKMIAMGLRNPQGLAFLADGSLLATEHGPRGGDRLSKIKKGDNYGWPFLTSGTAYNSYNPFGNSGNVSGNRAPKAYQKPIFTFIPSIAPTQLFQIIGLNPRWDGRVAIASLKAQSLYIADIVATPEGPTLKVSSMEQIFLGHRIRDMKQLGKRIWILDDNGALFSLEQAPGGPNDFIADPNIQATLGRCLICHALGPNEPTRYAPTFLDIYKRPIGSANFSYYSSAMKLRHAQFPTEIWDDENLKAYIQDPKHFLPGTSMLDLHLAPETVRGMVEALKKIKSP